MPCSARKIRVNQNQSNKQVPSVRYKRLSATAASVMYVFKKYGAMEGGVLLVAVLGLAGAFQHFLVPLRVKHKS